MFCSHITCHMTSIRGGVCIQEGLPTGGIYIQGGSVSKGYLPTGGICIRRLGRPPATRIRKTGGTHPIRMLAFLVNVAYEEEKVYIYLLFILKIQQKSACSKTACCHSIDKRKIVLE